MVDVAINPDDLPWQVVRKKLFTKNLATEILGKLRIDIHRAEPNAKFPNHVHTDDEWVYVLRGSIIDQTGEYRAGEFFINKKDSKHYVHAGAEGYEILILSNGEWLQEDRK
jgi:anti-sigma factor ChrR (cupin superfamily)